LTLSNGRKNAKNYIAQALSPAKELKVDLDEKEKTARVSVAPEELSLAIGKEGQNVRLASKLTGYRIEIEGDDKLSKVPIDVKPPVKKLRQMFKYQQKSFKNQKRILLR